MERESSKHSPRQDDELKHELRGTLQGNGSSRAEEWRDPESRADDDPEMLQPQRVRPQPDQAEGADDPEETGETGETV